MWYLSPTSLHLALLATGLCYRGIEASPTETANEVTRIIGGQNASTAQFPFIAHMALDKGQTISACGSSILSKDWIITAAHCVTDKNTGRVYSPSNFYFTVGQLSADFTDEYTASSITVHPDFDHERVVNDIALVKLTKPISLSTSVQPIRIWTNQVTTGLTATAIGWGSTDGVDTSQQATTLEYVNVTISNDQKKCIRLASQFVDSDQDVICTANNPGRDTCQGDSGGPLVVPADQSWGLLGLTSYGYSLSGAASCGASDGIAFYTHVAYYLDFITSTTKLDRSDITVGDNSSANAQGGNSTAGSNSSSTSQSSAAPVSAPLSAVLFLPILFTLIYYVL